MKFKNKIITALFFISVSAWHTSCVVNKASERETQAWIANAQKPITVRKHNAWDHFYATGALHYYTLIDSGGKTHLATRVRFNLPEVIK